MHALHTLRVPTFMNGCGSMTGIPGHSGGKRFATEQELVAATTRATVQQIDLSSLYGRKVNLFVNAMGDTGSGNLFGGRMSVVSQLRGDYIQSPPVTEKSTHPRYTSTTTNTATSEQSITSTVLSHPESTKTQQEGSGAGVQVGVEYKGLGAY